jgi:hypothetical protein
MTVRASPVDRFLAAIAAGRFHEVDALAEDVEMDATVPHWRFSVRGAYAVRQMMSRWYADPGQFEELRRTPLPDGELVEFLLCWEERGVPHATHQIHVLELDGTGHITFDRVWCGGRWPAPLLAEMAEAAAAGA